MTHRRCRQIIVAAVLTLGVIEGHAQPFEKEVYSISIVADSMPFEHPFDGGVYIPVHQFADIDGDGDFDLFVRDYNDGSIHFYQNVGTDQTPLFRFERPSFTLPPIVGFFRFIDITGDGKLDLLTAGSSSTSVAIYENTGTISTPQFTLLVPQLRDSADNIVYSQYQCIPALADMDGDGDLDFFSLNPAIGTINYYQNIGSATNFSFVFRTDRYQGIQICPGCDDAPSVSVLPPTMMNDNLMHGTGTMSFADVDGDGDYDMFYGDLYASGVFFYRNSGSPTNAVLDSVSEQFPPGTPVITGGFNQPSLVDIDHDSDKDMFVTGFPASPQGNNFWFYRNVGDSVNFNFSLVTKNFLNTFDVGVQSSIALVDIDSDGDKDLFVGSLLGQVAFLRNIGTPVAPSFDVEDPAFINNSSQFGYAPCFADIDSDGDFDMFLGHLGGNIEFYRNIGTPTQPSFQRQISFFDSVNVGGQAYAAPAFMDFDGDGDLDLFVGEANGGIKLFVNLGTPQVFQFSHQSVFLNISVGANARPQFADVDNDGDLDLIIGASDGKVHFYRNIGPPNNPTFVFVTDSYGLVDPMREVSPALADIDNDGDMDLFVGNYRGGVEFYRNRLITVANESQGNYFPASAKLFQNYPNPFNPRTTIRFLIPASVGSSDATSLRVYDMLGREVATLVDRRVAPGTYSAEWNAGNLASGMYFYQLRFGDHIETNKMILMK